MQVPLAYYDRSCIVVPSSRAGEEPARRQQQNKMNIRISIKETKFLKIATVAGLTSKLLVQTRTGQTRDRVEQISEISCGKLKVTVWWSLREQSDDLGRACALPWEALAEADHIELGEGSVTGTTGTVDSVTFLNHASALTL